MPRLWRSGYIEVRGHEFESRIFFIKETFHLINLDMPIYNYLFTYKYLLTLVEMLSTKFILNRQHCSIEVEYLLSTTKQTILAAMFIGFIKE